MTTLTRGRCAPLADLRPCQVRDPRWWETGNPNNPKAKFLCETACRFIGGCPRDNPNPVGVIVAGVAYDDWSQPLTNCDGCGQPLRRGGAGPVSGNPCPRCRPARAADHHELIRELRAADVPFPTIAERIGVPVGTLKDHWRRNAHRQPQPAKPALTPLPRPDGKAHRPTDHHDLVAELTVDPRYTAEDIAFVLGCTSGTVRAYWRRYGRVRWEAEQAAKQGSVAA